MGYHSPCAGSLYEYPIVDVVGCDVIFEKRLEYHVLHAFTRFYGDVLSTVVTCRREFREVSS